MSLVKAEFLGIDKFRIVPLRPGKLINSKH